MTAGPNPERWSSHTRPEAPTYSSWAPGEGGTAAPLLAVLREAGYLAQLGSRSVPAGNIEVRHLRGEAEAVAELILATDPGAYVLNTGR